MARIADILKELPRFTPAFQRAALEAIITLYPKAFSEEISKFIRITREPKLFAMAAFYLVNYNGDKTSSEILRFMQETFPEWQDNALLSRLFLDLTQSFPVMNVERPPLTELLRHSFGEGVVVFYSFQRTGRKYPGVLVLRKSDGTFYRDNQGNILLIPQLARSLSGLPGYITNGNAPQGIYSVKGIDVSGNVFIGPSPNIQTRLPFEVDAGRFMHKESESDTSWSRDRYAQMLPVSWNRYEPIFEAYYAGMAGRTEIIAHGTTVNPDFYRALECYPFTPSLGCLTTLEIWSESTGECRYSGQLALINAYKAAGAGDGYFIVVDVNDDTRPVNAADILPVLLESERH
jgi:hypothetical protein